MSSKDWPGKLDSQAAIDRHLAGLIARDARLAAIAETAGPFPPRNADPGFAGLARIVCGQQVSVASAQAIWGRFSQLPGATDPAGYLTLDEALIRAAGMSGSKIRTMRVLAEAIAENRLDFAYLDTLPSEEAVAYLTAHKGIGPWTAEVFLMFSAGHPDIFPAGDLALRKAVGHGLGLGDNPGIAEIAALARAWSPHRATAALLFWRYYAAIRKREGIAL